MIGLLKKKWDSPSQIAIHDKLYALHRRKVMSVRSRVGHKPFDIEIGDFIQMTKTKDDTDVYRQITVRTFGSKYPPNISRVRARAALNRAKMIEKHNAFIGKRLHRAQPYLDTKRTASSPYFINRPKRSETFIVPIELLAKYDNLTIPQEPDILKKLLRPKIFFDFEVKDVRPLGRMTFQLYTEACPEAVLGLVRLAGENKCDKIQFVRLFPELWIEGFLEMPPNIMTADSIEYDMRALNHDISPGILSFSHKFLSYTAEPPHNRLINFSLSFKKLNVLNGERVAFGKIRKGLDVLGCLPDFGTKNGKPIRRINITRMGKLY